MHTTPPAILQLDMPVSIALGRRSCCGARALVGEMQRAALHTTGLTAGRTAGEWQLASRQITSHPTGPRRRDASGAHPHLPLEMQDELQSDALGAALEETKRTSREVQHSGRLTRHGRPIALAVQLVVTLGGIWRAARGGWMTLG